MADLNTVKTFFGSKTVWGGLVALAAGLAGLVGYAISPEDQAQLVEVGAGLAATVGGAVAVVGRVVATKAIKK
ncbi:hypothetical protein [Megalodesulfovibrio paquesii]